MSFPVSLGGITEMGVTRVDEHCNPHICLRESVLVVQVDESMYDRYNEGDYIKVIHGALEGTEGRIVSINKETGEVEVETSFFGRTTKAQVDFSEIEKI